MLPTPERGGLCEAIALALSPATCCPGRVVSDCTGLIHDPGERALR